MFKSKTQKQLEATTTFMLWKISELTIEIQKIHKKIEELSGTEYEHGE